MQQRPVMIGEPIDSSDDDFWSVDDAEEPLRNALAFGWTEDGRCGFEGSDGGMQQCPRPIPRSSLRDATRAGGPKFAYKSVAAGSRHSVFILIDCRKATTGQSNGAASRSRAVATTSTKRGKILLLCGLNQMMLCEDPPLNIPTEIVLGSEVGRLREVAANNGATYVLNKMGHVYSFGSSKFGKLGYNDEGNSSSGAASNGANDATPAFLIPRRIMALERRFVTKLATASHHVLALTDANEVYSWGRNDKGQLGRGFESAFESLPALIIVPLGMQKHTVVGISCGQEHSVVLMQLMTKSQVARMSLKLETNSLKSSSWSADDTVVSYESFVLCFGDGSRGQLGSGDIATRSQPQENFWVTRLLRKLKLTLSEVVCGGYFTLALAKHSGQVISWGANDYGQLGLGHQHDSPEPALLRSLHKVFLLSAGLRHCLAAAESGLSFADVYGWGFNNWGELGLGDTDIRLYPAKISALKNNRILSLACGDRHSIIITAHKPMMAAEVPMLKPMFRMLREENTKKKRSLLKRLKRRIQREGMLHPNVLDNPNAALPNQAGSSTNEMKNDMFERGLRYCLDTFYEEFDWRRQAMEATFRVPISPNLVLQSVCLTCARRCVANYRLTPFIRARNKADPNSLKCDCNRTGKCLCRWSHIREAFDSIAVFQEDQCIDSIQLKKVLKILRSPFPVEAADVDDALLTLGHRNEKSLRGEGIPVAARQSIFAKRLAAAAAATAGRDFEDGRDDTTANVSRATTASDGTASTSTYIVSDDVRIDAVNFERWYRQYYDEPEPVNAKPFVQKLYTATRPTTSTSRTEDDDDDDVYDG